MTFLLETIRLGLANLRLQLLRSILTALGIIFGVAAVIAMVGIGEGSTREALAQIERLGARNLIVRSQKPPDTSAQQSGQQRGFINRFGLSYTDLHVIQQTFSDATAVVPLKSIGSEILRGDKRQLSQAYGTTPQLAAVARLRVARGRYLSQSDLDARALVCVIGADIANKFFPLEDPVGRTLRIDDKTLAVVGVLEPVGLSGGAGAALVGRDLNQDVHVPLTTARVVFGDIVVRRAQGSFEGNEVKVSEIYIESPTRDRVLPDAQRLRRIMEQRHSQPDWTMVVPFELLESAKKRAITGLAVSAAIAAISLLVGGIGIMNIMLATVTERTREIGVRRALGATRRHIQMQFVVETGVLSAVGGLLGVVLGIALTLGLDNLVPLLPKAPFIGSAVPTDVSLPTAVSLWSVIVAFSVAAATGLVFGIYPAWKASKQDPIVALRHD